MENNALLQVEHLHVQFGGVRAVDGVNIQVCDSEILGLIGPNGSGKTTLFNTITGINVPIKVGLFFRTRILLGTRRIR